ncbi:hypothetical protein ACN38_g2188 [Penicillium nordicum]|uniref:Uncharacterized protein n=1 Tax=Penicillium nordicum TaxID=229535 RepID=A0A0M8PF56_9EURO|nr:hypothetical protein ACN38_g2188 [Penicillium nordicum]
MREVDLDSITSVIIHGRIGSLRHREILRSCDSEMKKQHGRIRLRAEGRRGERERSYLVSTIGSVPCGAICLRRPGTLQLVPTRIHL